MGSCSGRRVRWNVAKRPERLSLYFDAPEGLAHRVQDFRKKGLSDDFVPHTDVANAS